MNSNDHALDMTDDLPGGAGHPPTSRDRLFILSLDLLCVADFQGRFLDLNPAWERTLGVPVDELLAKPYLEFVHPDDRRRTAAEADKLMKGTVTHAFENRYRCKDGSFKWLLWNAIAVPDESRIYAAARDISDRKEADERIQESENRLRSVLHSASDAVILADDRGLIIDWNLAAQRIFGYAQSEVVRQPLTLLIPERYREAHAEGLERLRRGGESRVIGKTVELHGVRKDGAEFPLELSLGMWRSGSAVYYSGIIRDISERKKHEEERDRLIQDLQDALGNIKILRGMLPICSYCKKVRDDKGYWNQIEDYLSEHSEALFTHGLCTTCARRLHPEWDES